MAKEFTFIQYEIRDNQEVFFLQTPYFKHEDSCLLWLEKTHPYAINKITVWGKVFDDYSESQREEVKGES